MPAVSLVLQHELGIINIFAVGGVVLPKSKQILEVGHVQLDVIVVGVGSVVVLAHDRCIAFVNLGKRIDKRLSRVSVCYWTILYLRPAVLKTHVVGIDSCWWACEDLGQCTETLRVGWSTNGPREVQEIAVENDGIRVQRKGEVDLDAENFVDCVNALRKVSDTVTVQIAVVG